ncbi:unnamed protein product [Brachionus calyciflorus]|uniref:VWFD domain-containing protein n=1 Tax=Brachionus calyciflorus TaxID=104777 RepID=A0A814GMD9_9BILA|nr:unnamed protein product [Brachionus calyciflorus]
MLSLLFVFFSISVVKGKPECYSHDDPHMKTFDGQYFEFQYSGDHYIMYDDFKDTRVTASYQKCNSVATCNCGVYLKKKSKVLFLDFCNDQKPITQSMQLYVAYAQNGRSVVKQVPPCVVISPTNENNPTTWNSINTFMEDFKCAKIQGGSYYDTYVLRTNEKNFEESVKVKFQVSFKSMPVMRIEPSASSFKNTGGICGLWDNSLEKEHFVLDKAGAIEFTKDITKIRDFWRLQSKYNKKNVIEKRCPECFLMAERSFYCPCDEFNLFDESNFDAENLLRDSYCKIPMYECLAKYFDFKPPEVVNPTTISPQGTTNAPTTLAPLTFEQSIELCFNSFFKNPSIAEFLGKCIDIGENIDLCAKDIFNTGELSFIEMHIDLAIDNIINNIISLSENCSMDISNSLCPNSCSNNGVCTLDQTCLTSDEIKGDCVTPIRCNCKNLFGGKDCSLDMSKQPNLALEKQCCDLRDGCESIRSFAENYSTQNTIYVKLEITETVDDEDHVIQEFTTASVLNKNTLLINLDKLKETNLYQNIHGEPTELVSSESLALVKIYINYDNKTFDEFKTLRLFDSKCRTCSQGLVTLVQDKCEIEGKCYDSNEPDMEKENYCNPSISAITWTPYDPICNNKNRWTEWFNLGNPRTNDGDYEFYKILPSGCKNASHVQIETIDGVDYTLTGQTVHLDESFGFMCINILNPGGCFDYRFRKCCPKNGNFNL